MPGDRAEAQRGPAPSLASPFRRGFAAGEAPRSGSLLNKARNRLKILLFDTSGAWLLHKRLDRGTFPIPVTLDAQATHIAVSAEELTLLLRGLGTERPHRIRRAPLH